MDFELHFTGLCLTVFDKENPSKATVLLVRDPHHRPSLTYYPRHLEGGGLPPEGDDLFVGPDLVPFARRDLTGINLTVPVGETGRSFEALRKPTAADLSPSQPYLDWVPSLTDINDRLPIPAPGDHTTGLLTGVLEGALPSSVAARAHLQAGSLEAHGVWKRPDGTVRQWAFGVWPQDRGRPNLPTSGIATGTVLRFRNLADPVHLRTGDGKDLSFLDINTTSPVRVAISNLPVRGARKSAHFRHFHHLYDLVDWAGLGVQRKNVVGFDPGAQRTMGSEDCPKALWTLP